MENETTPCERQQFGDFEIVREIGRGGMGIVFEAEQISLHRKVALKIMSSGLGITPNAVERFRREAEAAGRLHHTNIVPIYTFDDHDGVLFYAMELIAGPSLDRVLKQLRQVARPIAAEVAATTAAHDSMNPADPSPDSAPAADSSGRITGLSNSQQEYFDQVARMIAEVADALEHAHRQGIIHRDIKPSNLLLSLEGRLSVNDFGLARILEQPGVTVTGEFVGTPAYMSPEQIAAGRTPIDHRTDIYSLGATLYEMLTHQRPFPGERREQILAQILHKEPRRPRRINRAIPSDLETICLKALEKDPDRRYQSAAAMAEDLRRYGQRFAISARRVGPVGRLGKWVRRHPALAAVCTLALLLALIAGFFAHQSRQRNEELRQERLERALERVLVAGRGADFEGARQAIAEAEAAGASDGKLHFLRGYLALYEQHPDKAIEHLEQAADLLPDDLATHALLLLAYNHAGQMDRYYPRLKTLERFTAHSAEDLLFKGQAVGLAHPRQGLAILNDAVKKKDSLIARVARAEAAARFAETTGSITNIEQALADIAAARNLFPGYKGALVTSFWCNLRAAAIYGEHQLPLKRAQSLEQARLDAGLLDADAQISTRRGNMITYHDFLGDDDALLREYRRLGPNKISYIPMKSSLHALVRQGDFQGARQLLDQTSSAGIEMIQLVERGVVEFLDGNPEKALAAYREARRVGHKSRARVASQALLLLLGCKQEALEVYQENLRDPAFPNELASHSDPEWTSLLWAFTAGAISHKELEAAAQSSRFLQCEGCFFIGLDKFADGDRAGARDYFKKCVATGIFHFLEHRWSRSLLAVMDRHPDWPKKGS